MKPVTSISQIASLLADPKRSAMLWALIDGMARPSDELADITGLTLSSACAHLARLSASGLLKLEPRGRKRYFRLAGPEVGAAVEALASVQVTTREMLAAREDVGIPLSMRRARLCGDHLGGELAADLYQRLFDAGWLEGLEQQIEVTPEGRTQFASHGIFIEALARYQHRRFSSCRCCSEWSDHRPHLGGALGSSLLKLFMQSGWIRESETSRRLQISAAGLHQINRIAQPLTLKSVG
ncbi:ArsR/SmtB family transcription factor [Pseudomonas alkylphenolica]|uniref:ArsR family transcriptional regulator n=1 Tax=Pseudomonas alkylphenolica TaxID=237609 RepID=A0A077FH28_9PSED|nr:helix-turn-helix domain-containing protein [Pseudomonas alkylphenolica]AIL63820.1 ArsR family transcriptional regulator [Pseudomonas alkylphenolica]